MYARIFNWLTFLQCLWAEFIICRCKTRLDSKTPARMARLWGRMLTLTNPLREILTNGYLKWLLEAVSRYFYFVRPLKGHVCVLTKNAKRRFLLSLLIFCQGREGFFFRECLHWVFVPTRRRVFITTGRWERSLTRMSPLKISAPSCQSSHVETQIFQRAALFF